MRVRHEGKSKELARARGDDGRFEGSSMGLRALPRATHAKAAAVVRYSEQSFPTRTECFSLGL